jgi:parvulin-like peptidyl-prolyl isomerase
MPAADVLEHIVDWDAMHSRTIQWLRAGLVSAAFMCSAGFAHAEAFSDGVASLSLEALRQELDSVPADVRAMMSREQMGRFIANVLVDRRVMQAAERAGIAELPQVRASIARATREIMVRTWIEGEMAKAETSLPEVTELARERYLVNQKTYVVPEAIRVSHILFLVNEGEEGKRDAQAKARAMEVLQQLRDGADFEALAKEHSEDPGSKRAGGEIRGWSEKGRFVAPFEAAAYALKPGELSDLVRTRFGYHIIKLHEKRDARQQTFDEVKGPIIAALRKDMLAKKREDLLKPFQGRQPIELDDATLDALKKP